MSGLELTPNINESMLFISEDPSESRSPQKHFQRGPCLEHFCAAKNFTVFLGSLLLTGGGPIGFYFATRNVIQLCQNTSVKGLCQNASVKGYNNDLGFNITASLVFAGMTIVGLMQMTKIFHSAIRKGRGD